jgi:hypothetical protein
MSQEIIGSDYQFTFLEIVGFLSASGTYNRSVQAAI